MTTKVVKGSVWTLAGQVAPLAVSLVTTPFTIRLLGAEGYGVFILLGLIPNYFLFADFGMSMASTKFGSVAFAEGDGDKEARIVRTAALIAMLTSAPIALALILLSGPILTIFNVPENFRAEAVVALRIAALTLVVNFLCGIFNTPQLARLRMELNTLINAGSRIAGLIAMPVVLYLGYGVVGAMAVLLAAGVINLTGHILVSGRLLPDLFGFSIDREQFTALLKFGGGLVAAGILALLLANFERGALPRLVSIEALAFYTVAFTLISMLTMFSNAMIQSLIPAFSRLQTDNSRAQLQNLYSRGIRLTFIGLVPSVVFFAIIATPFFTIWAGEAYGRESSPVFYVMLFGLVFNVPAYLPYAAIMAAGRTDIFLKLFLAELVPYIALVILLTIQFGAVGAAAAWSIRAMIEGVLWFFLAKRVAGVSFSNVRLGSFAIAGSVMLIPLAAHYYFAGFSVVVLVLFAICSLPYALILWKIVLGNEELAWISGRVSNMLGRPSR